ncbi:hypothetical protein TNCV_2615501 [Trichonephila clavipes]|nr:hypothetical protein TNCV_2615501 [Trichonephila clavipes]
MIYGRVGSEELGENYNTLPLILVGDFNVYFASGDGQLLSAFQRDSLSKPETDESHLVRNQDCMADGVGQPTKSCNMVLHCRRGVWSRIVIQLQNARSEKPRPLFPNPSA